MQQIVLEEPYRFIPPLRSRIWPRMLRPMVRPYLKRVFGVPTIDFRGLEHYLDSLDKGHGILLASNHCRPADPVVVGSLVPELHRPIYLMASWHLFKQGRMMAWLIRLAGAFSIFREGMDKQALDTAIDILARAERPLVIFPEGAISRTNDILGPLQEGTASIARHAARRRAKKGDGKVVIHPVAIKYLFRGDLNASAGRVLSRIEERLSWQPQDETPLVNRVFQIGEALLTLKELEYTGGPGAGSLAERTAQLVEQVLAPVEKEWGRGPQGEGIVDRAKRVRSLIVPGLVNGNLSPPERRHRWRQLKDIYLAQQLSFYPPNYVSSFPTPERVLETVERFDEDLHDESEIHRPWHAIMHVGEAIPVEPQRVRPKDDPLMPQLHQRLSAMLAELVRESGEPLAMPEGDVLDL